MLRWHTVLCMLLAGFCAMPNLDALPLARLLQLLLLSAAVKKTKLLLTTKRAIADASSFCPAWAAQSRCKCTSTSCSSCSSR
jgi:hypothetical protein